ncbi:MAG: hypothetical protein V7K47_26245 [Nostoc sp.]
MAENPRQFNSLDYANADLYGAVLDRPSSAVPINLPLEDFANKPKSKNLDPLEKAFLREETARTDELFKQQREAQLAREQALAQREQERNLRLQQIPSRPPEPLTVSDRNYERQYEKQPTSSPEIPKPSPASLPPTPKGTAARASALVEPTQTPAPALLKEALPVTAGVLQKALPRSLPTAAGRLVAPGVIAGVDLASRLLSGQPVEQAIVGTAGSLIGSGVGLAVGSFFGGPIGGLVGSAVGGMIGGRIADMFFRQQLPTTSIFQEQPYINYPPYQGGQAQAIGYQIIVGIKTKGTPNYDVAVKAIGAIEDIQFDAFTVKALVHQDSPGVGLTNEINGSWQHEAVWKDIYGDASGEILGINSINIFRLDGQPDVAPDKQQPTPPPDGRPSYYYDPPLNRDATIPSGTLSNGTKGKINEVAPSKLSGGSPRGDGGDWIPGGYLAPGINPNPDTTPSNLGGMLPLISPAPTPPPFAEPEDQPIPRRFGLTSTLATITPATITPATDGVVMPVPAEGTDALGNYHDGKGGYFTLDGTPIPKIDTGSPDKSPSPSPDTQKANPTPDSVSPTPKKDSAPSPKTAPEQQATTEDVRKEFDKQLAKLNELALLIVGIGTVLTQLPNTIANNPNIRAANRDDVQGAVCEIAQPGGCLGARHDQTQQQNAQNSNKLDAINAALNAGNLGANAQLLAGQATILERLGAQLPGGLSGTFGRLWQTLQVDRILNILILITTFHNALMLSNNLAQTLFAAIDNISQAVGFKWKNEKGEESGFGSIVSEWTADFFKTIFGEENYTELVANYKKANRIYQATANIFNALQSIGYSILSALEVVGSYLALIGNALRKWGEVGESAYRWFNPTPNFHNKFFTAIEGATNVVSQVDQVASEVVSVEQNVAQIGELKNELNKSLSEENESKQGAIPPEATKVKSGFDASKLVSATGLQLNDSDFEAD